MRGDGYASCFGGLRLSGGVCLTEITREPHRWVWLLVNALKGTTAEGGERMMKLGNTRELDQHHLPIKILTRCRRRVHHRIRNTKRLRLT